MGCVPSPDALLADYRNTRSPHTLSELIRSYEWLVHAQDRSLAPSHDPESRMQAGRMALAKAIANDDPAKRTVRFSTRAARLVRNAMIDHERLADGRRGQKRHVNRAAQMSAAEGVSLADRSEPGPFKAAAAADFRRRVRDVLGEHTVWWRAVDLHFFDGLTVAESAEAMGVPEHRARCVLGVARRLLRRRITR